MNGDGEGRRRLCSGWNLRGSGVSEIKSLECVPVYEQRWEKKGLVDHRTEPQDGEATHRDKK